MPQAPYFNIHVSFCWCCCENTMLEDKIQELIDATEKSLLNQKDDIVLKAYSVDNCVNIMKDEVKDFVIDYVENDKFFKSIPLGVTERIQNHLEPIFRDAYVTSHIFFCSPQFFFIYPNL